MLHHFTVGVGASEAHTDIVRLGLDDPVSIDDERLETFWGLVFGFLLLTVGYQVHRARGNVGRVPPLPGAVVAGLGPSGVVVAPISAGLWAMLLLGLAVVVRADRDRLRPDDRAVVADPRRRRAWPTSSSTIATARSAAPRSRPSSPTPKRTVANQAPPPGSTSPPGPAWRTPWRTTGASPNAAAAPPSTATSAPPFAGSAAADIPGPTTTP